MIIKNNILPPKGYNAIAIFPFIFVRNGVKITDRLINHEKIHFAQQKELLILPFYLLYFIFFLVYGYRGSPFEQEAYMNYNNKDYLGRRKFCAWVNYF